MRLFRRQSDRKSVPACRPSSPGFSPKLESLEGRAVPAFLVQGEVDVTQLGPVGGLAGDEVEVDIAVNPANPQNVIVAPDTDQRFLDGFDRVFVSRDGGASFLQVTIPNAIGLTGGGDPTVVFDRTGLAVYAHLGIDNNGGLVLQSAISNNGGVSWAASQVSFGGADDKEFLAVGPDVLDLTRDRFYVGYQDASAMPGPPGRIFAQTSFDGQLWFGRVQVSDPGNEGINAQIAVGNNGEVYCVWQETNVGGTGTPGTSRVFFDVSLDGGLSWGNDRIVAVTNIDPFNDPATLTGSYTISAAPDRGVGAYLSIDVDRSPGPFRGNIYVSIMDQGDRDNDPDATNQTDHDNTDIFVTTSNNGGLTFSPLVRVNDDNTLTSQFHPWLDVDPVTGLLGIMWYDAREDPLRNELVRVFTTASIDGGQTFEPNVPVSRGQSNESLDVGDPDYLEYENLEVINSVFYMTWADNSDSLGVNPSGPFAGLDIHFARPEFQLVSGITLTPLFDANAVGDSHTVVATVFDTTGRPTAGEPVDFIVIGPNGPIGGTVVTNQNGQAFFTYIGVNPGSDTIIASTTQVVTTVSNPVTKLWLLPANLSGTVYVDTNDNAVQDPGEPGIPTVTVTLTGIDFVGNPITVTTVTDAAGNFNFPLLTPGVYTLSETQPAAYFDGRDTVGVCGGVPDNDVFAEIVVAEGTNCSGYLFGERGIQPTFISKRLFFSSTGSRVIPGSVTRPGETAVEAVAATVGGTAGPPAGGDPNAGLPQTGGTFPVPIGPILFSANNGTTGTGTTTTTGTGTTGTAQGTVSPIIPRTNQPHSGQVSSEGERRTFTNTANGREPDALDHA